MSASSRLPSLRASSLHSATAAREAHVSVASGDSAPPTSWSFDAVLGPVSVERFCEHYWARRPLRVARGNRDYYRNLIRLEDVEQYIGAEDVLGSDAVRLRQRGYAPFEHPPDLGTVYAGLVQGKSLQLRSMERYFDRDAKIMFLLRSMESSLQHPKESLSCYVTPASGESLGPHLDETDIFTLQIEGAKTWRFYHSVETDEAQLLSPSSLGPPTDEFVLEAGDFLYHPRGLVHEVSAGNAPSFSITIVFRPVLWRSLLECLWRRVSDLPPFVGQMPAGAILEPCGSDALRREFDARVDVLRAELDRLRMEDILTDLAATHVTTMRVPTAGHLRQVFRIDELRPESRLERYQDAAFRIERSGFDPFELVGPGATRVALPADTEAAVRFVLATKGDFRVNDIPLAAERDRVCLAKILVREAVVRVCCAAETVADS